MTKRVITKEPLLAKEYKTSIVNDVEFRLPSGLASFGILCSGLHPNILDARRAMFGWLTAGRSSFVDRLSKLGERRSTSIERWWARQRPMGLVV